MLNIMGYVYMILSGAVAGLMAFLKLLETGAPILGIALFGCGACFVGGWLLLAKELDDAS